MEKFIFKNEIVQIAIGSGSEFINVSDFGMECDCLLRAPRFEIDGRLIGGSEFELAGIECERGLRNGGREICFKYMLPVMPDIKMLLTLRVFPGSPFIRFKYSLASKMSLHMTKSFGKDNIEYTGLSTTGKWKLTEIQFSQFEKNVYSFIPGFQTIDVNELAEGLTYPGPISIMEHESCSCLLAYEHGAEYPESFLVFDASEDESGLHIGIRANKGNYFADQIIELGHPFESPWFHFAICKGNMDDLFVYYRLFFLKFICENTESRKPYIYYNTWTNQERDKYYRNLPYLNSMNLEHITKEIDIAHTIGIDVFVIDVGWFYKTGDWAVNMERFPDGFREIRKKLEDYGMKFGVWVNPSAAKTSDIFASHPEYAKSMDGEADFWGEVCETEESYGMCLASEYSDYFIDKLEKLNKHLGITYFKWDAVGQHGCNSPLHRHGNENNTAMERHECFSYKMGMEMIRIVEEVTRRCPEVIIDFDITEGNRFVGLGFLAVGKYFLMNNGPFYGSFDIPINFKREPDTINVFFHPGPARSRICRQGLKYDRFVPSNLFLTHFLPDSPALSQRNSLASLMLGGNGLWGELLNLSREDIALLHDALAKYKMISWNVALSCPKTKGFIGSSPEIYEKIDYMETKGIICFFTKIAGTFTHVTSPIDAGRLKCVEGADRYELTSSGRLKITVSLEQDDARIVYIF
jgi:alpha-galactosidase